MSTLLGSRRKEKRRNARQQKKFWKKLGVALFGASGTEAAMAIRAIINHERQSK